METGKPVIIIAGTPDWSAAIEQALATEYSVIRHTSSSGYMNSLIEARAALVLVDGEHADWQRRVAAAKVSPATRRIPLLVISDDPAVRAAAPLQGADLAFSRSELYTDPQRVVREWARQPDPERQAQLDCECAELLPPLAQEGVRRFNAGEYYQQHDLFEEQWVHTAGPVRDLYRAVLQVGVAYFQIQRGNYRGALKTLQRSVQWLLVLPDRCQGINVKKLREDSFRVRAELERLGEARFSELDLSLIQGVEWDGDITADPDEL